MPFTAQELGNIANATLDLYIRGAAMEQVIQARPTYDKLRAAQKTFPGGQGLISLPVLGEYDTTVFPYTHDDTVPYLNPANIRRATYRWREHHAGIGVTLTELKHDGISVVDSLNSASTSEHSRRELISLTGLLENKLRDLAEGWARDFTAKLWRAPATQPNNFLSIRELIEDDPTVNTIAGLDRALLPWWRNRAQLNIPTTPGGEETIFLLHREVRQLRRYGGNPTCWVAGSDMLDRIGVELRSRGQYTDSGFTKRSNTDVGMADLYYNGNPIIYDPALDDAGRANFLYIMDPRHLYLQAMTGEDMKRHSPARPHNQYTMYRAITWTGQLVMDMANCHGVYSI